MSSKQSKAPICIAEGDRSWARRRWEMLALPLLCGLLAAICVFLLAFQPLPGQMATLWAVGAVATIAAAVELNRSNALCRRGLIELRSVRHRGVERPAFLIPYCPHFLAMCTLLLLLLLGLSFDLLVVPSLHPTAFRNPSALLLLGAVAMVIGVVGTRNFLRWIFLRPPGLALLPEGLLLISGGEQWFIAWDWLRHVTHVRLRFVVTFFALGLRLTEIEDLPMTPRQRRRLMYNHTRSGWHLLQPLWFFTLPVQQVAFLVNLYRQKPGQRATIGSEEGLAYLEAGLAYIASHQTTPPPPTRVCA